MHLFRLIMGVYNRIIRNLQSLKFNSQNLCNTNFKKYLYNPNDAITNNLVSYCKLIEHPKNRIATRDVLTISMLPKDYTLILKILPIDFIFDIIASKDILCY